MSVRQIAESGDQFFGELGRLTYDPIEDRIQCHVCGRWLQKLESKHLNKHSLTVPEYKELFGLNESTPLETPRITERRRQANREHEGWRNLSQQHSFRRGAVATRRGPVREQFRREHFNSEVQRTKSRAWSDDEMLAFLREQRAVCGGYLKQEHLNARTWRKRGESPSRNAVIERFGSWQRVCELLDQPYRMGRPRVSGAWSNTTYEYKTLVAAFQAAQRTLADPQSGSEVALAPEVVPGLMYRVRLWTNGIIWRAYESAPGATGSTEPVAIPSSWR